MPRKKRTRTYRCDPLKYDDDLSVGIVNRLYAIKGSRSQNQWAKDLRVPQQNISRYLSGGAPHVSFLIRVLEVEDVDVNWLLVGD